MPAHTLSRRRALWVAIVFVWAMLAPSLSVALAQARGDYSLFQEICRSSSAAPRGDSAPADALTMLTQGHCPACQIHWQDLAPPPAPVAAPALLRRDLAHVLPARFWQAPVTAHAWRPASARAPPQPI
jgi:hypothetical protein